MRCFKPLLVILAITLSFSTFTSAQVTTDPVGFITETVKGTVGLPGSPPNALSFVGLSFTQPVAYQATFTANGAGTTLTDGNATWTDNQFNGAGNRYYVELITGGGVGKMSQITGTSGTNKTITTADDLSSSVSNGTGYKIRKNWTIASVFGTTNQAGIFGGDVSSSDKVLVYSQTLHSYTTFYYQTSGLGGVGWRTTASNSADASNEPAFLPTDGLLVRRAQSADVTFALAGAVKLGQTAAPIVTGLNIVSNPYPSGTLTLGNSNLYTGAVGGFAAGSVSSADQVQIYNAASAQYSTYYYQTSGLGGTGWRSTASNSTDAQNTAIPFGQSIIIQRNQSRPAFSWVIPQPF
jgi:uncharacterized protein (TIGR02597 family)